MFKRGKAIFLALLLVSGLFGATSPAQAVTTSLKEGTDLAAPLFDPLAISKVEITRMAGYPALTFDYLNSNDFRHANVKITLSGKAAVTLNNVGIRLKGQASRGDAKFPMKLKFDEFVPNQNFLGLKRMTLNNMVQDPSFVHEATAYKMYRAAGVPAPRAGYSRVFVEGQSMGLYLNLESVDKTMTKRWYPSTTHIYAGPYNCDIVPGNYCYEATIGDTNRTRLNNAGEVHNLHGEAWWGAINQVADMSRVIKLMATDIFLSNWDGYSDAVQNNHFAHFDADGKVTIIPWGLDQTFTVDPAANLTWDASGPIFRNWSDHRSTLLDHCIEYTPCHNEIIREGVRIAQLSETIDLVGYKDLIAQKINPIVTAAGELRRANLGTLSVTQGWIDVFMSNRQEVLADFLSSRAPSALSLSVPESVRVGSTVKGTLGSVWEPGVTARYQWQVNGENISGATGISHRVTADQMDEVLTLKVTLSKSGVSSTTVTSNESSVLGKLFTKAAKPIIIGTAARGKILRVSTGTWDSGTAKSIQWLSGGEEIDGATYAIYKVSSTDAGSSISVRITGTKSGHVETIRTSRSTSIIR
jgi:hypothetical protein